MVYCLVGLGANIGDPLSQLRRAVHDLRTHPGIAHVMPSPVYRTPPMGPPDQPDYLNAVAGLDTELAPEPLLDILQAIERGAGRVRGRRWGQRTLDLDLLL
ncbi:MAG: 2-amino-4-hydroxy-6-hydroxymethyldihydropteridine diphosphokinase [Chromatocurvus sp.]